MTVVVRAESPSGELALNMPPSGRRGWWSIEVRGRRVKRGYGVDSMVAGLRDVASRGDRYGAAAVDARGILEDLEALMEGPG